MQTLRGTRRVPFLVTLVSASIGGCQAAAPATPPSAVASLAPRLSPADPSPTRTIPSPTPTTVPSPSAAAAVGACADLAEPPTGRILFELADGDAMRSAIVSARGDGFRLLTDGDTDGAPAWSPGDRVLLHSRRAGNTHVFEVPLAGGAVRQLSTGDGDEGMPAAIPGGHRFVVDANTPGAPSGLWLLLDDGMRIRRLTTNPAPDGFDTAPDVSPDGRTVAFARVLDATPGVARSAIFVAAIDGSELRQLTDWSTNAHHPGWSPDGTRIAFSTNADNNTAAEPADLWVIGADGSGLTRLTREPAGRSAFEPAWAPEGEWIAFVGDGLEAMTADGSRRCQVWAAADGSLGFVKHPDWIAGS